MKITAAMVKELRERTGSGMMECKKALVQTGGDLESAVEEMRKSGLASADKKSGRTAAEGCIVIGVGDGNRKAAMVEVNSETDFVAKGDDFREFANGVAATVLDSQVNELEDLLALPMAGSADSVDETRRHLVAKLGENINVRRFERYSTDNGLIASYLHGSKIGVIVELSGGDGILGKDIAMHIAASRPLCVAENAVPPETIAKEKEIFSAQAAQSGKPANIIEKMIEGRLKKFLGEITLLGQPFVKNPDLKIGQLLDEKAAAVVRFSCFEVGEGIQKRNENFAEEVMAQVQGV